MEQAGLRSGRGMARTALTALFLAASLVSASANGPVVGGYSPASRVSPEIAAAVRFAAQLNKVKLRRILSAETQVVAGQNFRLCLSVSSKSTKYRAMAVVYQDLSGHYSLSEWKPHGC